MIGKYRDLTIKKKTELEAKLTELQQELGVLQLQEKRTPIAWDDLYNFSGSDSEPTSGRLTRKRKKSQAFPLAISYGGFFLSKAKPVCWYWLMSRCQ